MVITLGAHDYNAGCSWLNSPSIDTMHLVIGGVLVDNCGVAALVILRLDACNTRHVTRDG